MTFPGVSDVTLKNAFISKQGSAIIPEVLGTVGGAVRYFSEVTSQISLVFIIFLSHTNRELGNHNEGEQWNFEALSPEVFG